MTVAGQEPIFYSYDSSSRLTNLQSGILNFGFAYDALGRRTSLLLPNGVTTTYAYDNASHLLNLQHVNNALNQTLESLTYTYDAIGNRISMNRPSVSLPLPNAASNTSYNNANQMLSFNDKNITYDNNGNMTSVTNGCGITNYTWNARNQLVGIQGFNADCSALIANFKYDALGRRVEKTINGKTIQYLYDGLDIVQEIENGMVSANYIRTLNVDEPLARIKSDGTVRYYQTDALGSVISLTTENGQLATSYSYDPFGNVTISGEASDNSFQYTGRENDGTGLYYYRARYYSSELQRFISSDPAEEGINYYVYVKNNPLLYVDLTGETVQTCCGMTSELPLWPVMDGLECMSKCLKCTILISSGLRFKEPNDKTKGAAKGSYHLLGLAADVHEPPSQGKLRKAAAECGFSVLAKVYPNRIHVELRNGARPKNDPDECVCKKIREGN